MNNGMCAFRAEEGIAVQPAAVLVGGRHPSGRVLSAVNRTHSIPYSTLEREEESIQLRI